MDNCIYVEISQKITKKTFVWFSFPWVELSGANLGSNCLVQEMVQFYGWLTLDRNIWI